MDVLVAEDFIIDPRTMTGGVDEEFLNPQARSPNYVDGKIHLGEILRDIENRALARGHRPKYNTLRPEEVQRMGRHVEMGFIWEQLTEFVWRSRQGSRRGNTAVKQVEIEDDGVIMTPDAWYPLDDVAVEATEDHPAWDGRASETGVVGDDKATWRSSRRWDEDPETNFWHWLTQLRCYCRAHHTRRGRLTVLWINGDYRESGPQSRNYELLFGQRELDDNWRMVVRHKNLMIKEANA